MEVIAWSNKTGASHLKLSEELRVAVKPSYRHQFVAEDFHLTSFSETKSEQPSKPSK